MLAANPDRTYLGPAPDPLLAIPVLEIELNADGSVRRIEVLRPPRQAPDTVQIAADAVRRAAPFARALWRSRFRQAPAAPNAIRSTRRRGSTA